MRHASPITTVRYVNLAKPLNPAVQALNVLAAVLTAGAVG
jgi:hypothetical protein